MRTAWYNAAKGFHAEPDTDQTFKKIYLLLVNLNKLSALCNLTPFSYFFSHFAVVNGNLIMDLHHARTQNLRSTEINKFDQ